MVGSDPIKANFMSIYGSIFWSIDKLQRGLKWLPLLKVVKTGGILVIICSYHYNVQFFFCFPVILNLPDALVSRLSFYLLV